MAKKQTTETKPKPTLKEVERHGYTITLTEDGVFVDGKPVNIMVMARKRQIMLPSGHYIFIDELE